MSRRGTPQVIALVAVAILFIYGFYEYHDVKSALRRSEDLVRRSKVEKENLSTQLQGALEQKLRLEASIQKERESFKKSKDELSKSEKTCLDEKKGLVEKFKRLDEDLKQIKSNYETLQAELEQHKDGDARHDEERARLTAENRRLKQEGDNDIAGLRDEVANLKRQNQALQAKQVAQPKVGGTGDKLPLQAAAGDWNLNNRVPNMAQNAQDAAQGHNQKVKQEFDIPMQINKPDDDEHKPYFEPKEAKPDHPILKRDAPIPAVKPQVHEQVAPPDVNNEVNEVVERKDTLRRGAKADYNNRRGNNPNPMFPNDDRARLEREFGRLPGAANVMNQDHQRVVAAAGKLGGLQNAKFADTGLHDIDQADPGQVQKPLQIVEPHLQHEEENQLQGPRNDRHGNRNDADKEEEGNDNDNEEDYQYENKEKKLDGKAAVDSERDRMHNDGPHAAPIDEDDQAGLRR